jgi:hypothetical protein
MYINNINVLTLTQETQPQVESIQFVGINFVTIL